ncbi:MAG TPA: hypothetical protein VFC30_07055 [Solirubrobacteraceae bacterium]|nr:hypothetical protein [Solirubrobacteraceae bacterium]
MGKRNRRRTSEDGPRPEKPVAPSSDYTDAYGATLTLRGALSPATRRDYAQVLTGAGGRPSDTQEDAWQRAVELLFERLAVRWVIAGAPIERQRELLMRFRVASTEERAWIRMVLREHLAENFPDVQAP